MKRILEVVLLTGALTTVGSASNVTTLTLNPADGAVQGQPGQSVGWGFTIVDDTFWVTVSGTDFCTSFNTGPSPDPFPCNNQVQGGTYQDFTQFNPNFESSPGVADTSQQNFNALSHLGTGSFTIGADTPISSLLSGEIVVVYDLFNADPFDPNSGAVQQGGDMYITSMASVIPEPGTLVLMGTALVGLGLLRRRVSANNKDR